MAETIRCPFCGGSNPAGAQWCGQCLEPFAPPAPDVPEPAAVPSDSGPAGVATPGSAAAAPTRVPAGPSDGSTTSFSVSTEGILWTCPTCETKNPIESDICSVCGTTFAQMVRPEPPRVERDPNTTALISLFFPGAGHAYLRLWGEAIARAIISTWAIAVALIAAFAGKEAAGRLITILFGAIAFALWGIAAHDSYRTAAHDKHRVLLKGRGFLYLVLGMLGLLLLVVVGSALGAR